MARMRFALVGEGQPLASIAMHLAKSSAAEIISVATGRSHADMREAPAGDRVISVREFIEAPPAAADWLINVNSDAILPRQVLERYEGRALNLHNGPLPAYAGRHVTQWGIRNGEESFAATVHFMEPGVDTGDIVAERTFGIRATDTGLSLFLTSFREGRKLMADVLDKVMAGEKLPRLPQDLARRRNYRHAEALDAAVPWSAGAQKAVDFMRAGDYRPVKSPSYTATVKISDGESLLLYRGERILRRGGKPGEFLAIEERGPVVACGEDSVLITQAAIGGVRVGATEWHRLLAALPAGALPGR